MPQPIHLIYQDELIRGTDLMTAEAKIELRTSRIDLSVWRDQLAELDAETKARDERPMIFCSLPVAGYIRRTCPTLARGILLPRDFLDHHAYSAVIPEHLQLNTGGLYLPWGRIPAMAAILRETYPTGVFIRPNSPMKPFTGFAVDHDRLSEEHRIMTRAASIDPAELCLIASRQDLDETEYRVWIVETLPVTAASYGWTESASGHDVPAAIWQAARELGEILEMFQQTYTADFILKDGRAKLVELNAMSTSGWYEGLDPEALLKALEPTLV